MLFATIDKEADKVAEIIEQAHDTYTSVLKYNDENSLSCVLTMAYFTAPAYYDIIREHPAGKGYADFIFKPRANAGWRPAMVVELKYNQSADTAIKQGSYVYYKFTLTDAATVTGSISGIGTYYLYDELGNREYTDRCSSETEISWELPAGTYLFEGSPLSSLEYNMKLKSTPFNWGTVKIDWGAPNSLLRLVRIFHLLLK